MTWTKLPDDLPDRLIGLSDAAFRLHITATVYANRLGLDGVIPKARLSLIPITQATRRRRMTIVRELIAAGLWQEGEVSFTRGQQRQVTPGTRDRWTLLDFYEGQLSAEEVSNRRAYDAIRQRIRFANDAQSGTLLREEASRIRAELFDSRERRREWASLVSHSVTHNVTHTLPASAPARPVPSRKDEDEDESGAVAARLDGAAPAPPPEREPQPALLCPQCGEPIIAEDGARLTVVDDALLIEHVGCRAAREAATA
jgi:hypothetical protein